ncbi:hypothetical protein M5J14_18565 [Lysinibacillus sp. OL1_EC]|uniref:hypothetical protein n=1 Tax=unclassified Lysinibacillus TaxID=2636778 RepID=UPI00103B1460|nr:MULTISPECIES: hypothetical protein [unclassified Lysinibacillus]MCM0626502.1 hypothetical protein [Lysinibacillus sp. OL1_EC]TBV85637.1 hypothetical protein EW028_19620 [Lysinibacillus sp. OL1]
MRRRNGIPIDVPGARKAPKVKTQKPVEYNQYNVYVTMFKFEDGIKIWTMVPLMHPDFKKLRKEGYRITEKWDKREVSA